MTVQAEIPETKQSDYGPDQLGFYHALLAEIAVRTAAAKNKSVMVEKVSTPAGASDAVGMYGSQ